MKEEEEWWQDCDSEIEELDQGEANHLNWKTNEEEDEEGDVGDDEGYDQPGAEIENEFFNKIHSDKVNDWSLKSRQLPERNCDKYKIDHDEKEIRKNDK